MNLCVAIQAVAAEQVLRCRTVRQAVGSVGEALMVRLRMAALAQHRSAQTDHAWIVRAVRVVTVRAILGNRGMLPQVRATLFGVALETGVVERLADEQAVARLSVRAVTTGAGHFPLVERMRIRLHGLRALLLVTIEAHFRLTGRTQHRVVGNVNLVAARATATRGGVAHDGEPSTKADRHSARPVQATGARQGQRPGA